MTLKLFSYGMIGAFVASLGMTIWGSVGVLAGCNCPQIPPFQDRLRAVLCVCAPPA